MHYLQDLWCWLVLMLYLGPPRILVIQSLSTYLHFYHQHIGFLLIHILANTLYYQIITFVYLIVVKILNIFNMFTAHSSFCQLFSILSPFPNFFFYCFVGKHFIFWVLTIYQLCIVRSSAELGERVSWAIRYQSSQLKQEPQNEKDGHSVTYCCDISKRLQLEKALAPHSPSIFSQTKVHQLRVR